MLKTPEIFFAALMISAVGAPALAETIAAANTLVELGNQLNACVDRNANWSSSGEITVVFSLRRDGSLIGHPHVSYLRTAKDVVARQQMMDETAGLLAQCLPAKITDGLGGAIAGQMHSWHFTIRGKENGI